MDKRVKTTVKLPPDLWKLISDGFSPGDTFQDWLADAAQRKLSAAGISIVPTVPCYSKHDQALHKLLDVILQDGTPKQINWIAGNLKTFVQAISSKPVGEKRRKTGSSGEKTGPVRHIG